MKINKKEILNYLEESSSNIPKLSKSLDKAMNLIKKENPSLESALLIATDKNHPLGGGSQLYFKNKNKSKQEKDFVYILDEYFKKLKIKRGISIKHDWKKDGFNNLDKGLK